MALYWAPLSIVMMENKPDEISKGPDAKRRLEALKGFLSNGNANDYWSPLL